MTFFLVDDKLHANRKIRKLIADDPAALALWTVAGSWCGGESNDGFVPDDQLKWLFPEGAEQLANKLVSARLWAKVRGGYRFHQWNADGDGTKRNPTKREVEEKRRARAEAGRLGGLASGKARSKRQASASAKARAPAKPIVEPHIPSPSKEGKSASPPASPGGGLASADAPPPAVSLALFKPPADLIAETRERLKSASRKAHAAPSTLSPFQQLMALPDSPNGSRPHPMEAPDDVQP